VSAPPVSGYVDVARRALFGAFLRAASRRYNLLERVPARFAQRGWDLDDRVQIATMALAFVAMRKPDAKVEVYPSANDPPCWAKIVGATAASVVVDALELRDLIKDPA
jgi:hypothetical protein